MALQLLYMYGFPTITVPSIIHITGISKETLEASYVAKPILQSYE